MAAHPTRSADTVRLVADTICFTVCPEGAHEQGSDLCFEVAEIAVAAALNDGEPGG